MPRRIEVVLVACSRAQRPIKTLLVFPLFWQLHIYGAICSGFSHAVIQFHWPVSCSDTEGEDGINIRLYMGEVDSA